MDHHAKVEGLTAQAVADAHRRDLETQGEYGVNYLKYWFDEKSGQVWCLVGAPDAQAAATVHREAHGLVAEDLAIGPRAVDAHLFGAVRCFGGVAQRHSWWERHHPHHGREAIDWIHHGSNWTARSGGGRICPSARMDAWLSSSP
jgi:hypothetical protein